MQKIETGISELLKRQPVTEQEKDAYIRDLQKALRLLLEEVRDLEEMVALLQKKRFGSSMQKSDAERHLHGVLATPCRRASDTSPP